jgi:hypothetical protein
VVVVGEGMVMAMVVVALRLTGPVLVVVVGALGLVMGALALQGLVPWCSRGAWHADVPGRHGG